MKQFLGNLSRSDGRAPNDSARPLVAKLFQPAACLLILLCAGGCDSVIDFDAETVVFPDSAVTRKTRVVPDQTSKDEIHTRYVLPPDWKWESGKRIKRSPDGKKEEVARSIYEVEKQYQNANSGWIESLVNRSVLAPLLAIAAGCAAGAHT